MMIGTFDLGGRITILRIRTIGRYPTGLTAAHGPMVGLGAFHLGIVSGIMDRDGRTWMWSGSEKVAGRFLLSMSLKLLLL